MSDENCVAVGSGAKEYGMNKLHNKGVPGSARSPNIHYCLIVAVEEELPSRPLMPPEKACKGNGVELLPLNWSVPEFRGPGIVKPVVHVEDAIAKTARGIREEFQIWWFGPVGIRYNGPAIPRRKKPEPPGKITTGFTIDSDMVMWKACWSGVVDKVAQKNACGDDLTGKVQFANQDRSSLLRHFLRVDQDWSSDINSWSLSSGREVSMEFNQSINQ